MPEVGGGSHAPGGGRLAGRVAVVTGGGRGIGRSVATAFAREGAAVVVAARSAPELDAVVDEVGESGGTALAVPTDVTDDASVAALHAATRDRFGPAQVVVNNAGMHVPGRFEDYSVDEWRRFYEVNVLGVVRMLQAFLPGMVAAGYGKVVNMASTAGKYGSLYQSPYNATKHAVVGLTRCLALEQARTGVRVNAICPGFVRTELMEGSLPRWQAAFGLGREELEAAFLARVPQGRFLEPEEVASLAVYLASAESDGMTGQSILLDGGLVLV